MLSKTKRRQIEAAAIKAATEQLDIFGWVNHAEDVIVAEIRHCGDHMDVVVDYRGQQKIVRLDYQGREI